MSEAKRKILVVDDDAIVQQTLAIKFRDSNYELIEARDGSAAVHTVRTTPPDAILCDISFPTDFGSVAWDGFGILEWLKRIDALKEVPILVISSGDPAKYANRAKELGALGFFRKPIDHDELRAALDFILAKEPAVAPKA
jgi:CheY-like chemotaxis protein